MLFLIDLFFSNLRPSAITPSVNGKLPQITKLEMQLNGDGAGSINLPEGYTYENTVILVTYGIVNGFRYDFAYNAIVSSSTRYMYIGTDNKIHVLNTGFKNCMFELYIQKYITV